MTIMNKLSRPLAILLVEDDVLNQRLTYLLLEKRGYTVDAVNNGEKALELLLEKNYDSVLLDLYMDGMDGFEVAKRIRQFEDQNKANIPIIAITAFSEAEVKSKLKDLKVETILTKPFQIEEVEKTLQAIFID